TLVGCGVSVGGTGVGDNNGMGVAEGRTDVAASVLPTAVVGATVGGGAVGPLVVGNSVATIVGSGNLGDGCGVSLGAATVAGVVASWLACAMAGTATLPPEGGGAGPAAATVEPDTASRYT